MKPVGVAILALLLAGCGGGTGGSAGPRVLTQYSVAGESDHSFFVASGASAFTQSPADPAAARVAYRPSPGAPSSALTAPAVGQGQRLVPGPVLLANSFTRNLGPGPAWTLYRPVLWTAPDATPVLLPLLPGRPFAIATSGNALGQAVGRVYSTGNLSDPTDVYWPTSASVPVPLAAGAGVRYLRLSSNGALLVGTFDGTHYGVRVAASVGGATRTVALPPGFTDLEGPVLGPGGQVLLTAYAGRTLEEATRCRAYRIDPTTAELSELAAPVGVGSFAAACAGTNGWVGGWDPTTNRAVLVRGDHARYVDELLAPPTGDRFVKVLAILDDETLIVQTARAGQTWHTVLALGG